MSPSCPIPNMPNHVEILLKSYRLRSKVLGTPSKVRDGQDRFLYESSDS